MKTSQSQIKSITVLATSDIHGNLMPWDYYANKPAEWGLAKVATLIEQERAKHPNLLLIDNGDIIQGTPLTYYYNKIDTQSFHPIAAAMNALRFDSTTLGNHEFNYGLNVLARWVGQLNFPVLSANIRNIDDSEAYKPYIIKNVDGVQVGILGLTTPVIPTWEPPSNIAGLRFDNPIAIAKQYVPKMRSEGADVIIVAQHTGWSKLPKNSSKPEAWLTDSNTWEDAGYLPDENATIDLADQVSGIDIILAGHSHIDVPKTVINDVLIAEPSFWGRALSKYTIQLKRSGHSWQIVTKNVVNLSVKDIEPNPKIVSISKPYHEETLKYISKPIGIATEEFVGGVKARYFDSPLGDLINHVQSEAAAAEGYPVDVSLATIFTDTGMIPKGQITLGDIYSIYVYDNQLYIMEIKGDILRGALERNAEYFKQVSANNLPTDPKAVVMANAHNFDWDLYSGIDYTIDITKPVGKRVTQLQFKGQDVEPDQKLRIAINNYRASGSGGYFMFKKGKILWQSTKEIRDLIADYVRRQGTIDPQAINTINFKMVPDLYTHYFGATAEFLKS